MNEGSWREAGRLAGLSGNGVASVFSSAGLACVPLECRAVVAVHEAAAAAVV